MLIFHGARILADVQGGGRFRFRSDSRELLYRFERCVLDIGRRELRRDGALIAVEPQVFDLLVFLVVNRDRVLTKEDLLASVWGRRIVSESTIGSRINAARRVIGDAGREQRLIRTIIGKGLRFVGAVEEQPTAVQKVETFPSPRLSIIVLPFINSSDNPQLEYFAGTITENLTTDLSRISGSFVIARATARAYKAKSVDVRQIGRELDIRYVVEGSICRFDASLQVNVQLVDAATGAHLWADRFEVDCTDLPMAQNKIGSRLARTIELELLEAVGRQIEHENSTYPNVPDLLLLGWAWYYRPTSNQHLHKALKAFQNALELDGESAEARIGIATVLVDRLSLSWPKSPEKDHDGIERLLSEALEHNRNDHRAYYAMGVLRMQQDRFLEARIAFEQAIALERTAARAHLHLGFALLGMGEPNAALPHFEEAFSMNPKYQNIQSYYSGLGAGHLFLGHVDEAIVYFRKARALTNIRLWYNAMWLTAALGLKDDLEETKEVLTEFLELKPEWGSLARLRAAFPWSSNNPQFAAIYARTVELGLRRAGLPEE